MIQENDKRTVSVGLAHRALAWNNPSLQRTLASFFSSGGLGRPIGAA